MATKKAQSVKPKATKTVAAANGKTKTVPAKKPTRKPATKKSNSNTVVVADAKPKCNACRIIACIIGAIAMIALVAIVIVAITNNINKGQTALVVENGDGEEIETVYVTFNDKGFRMKVPKILKELEDDELAAFNSNELAGEKVLAAYADEAGDTSLIITRSDNEKVTNDQIGEILTDTEEIMNGTLTKVISSNLTTKNGHNFANMEVAIGSNNNGAYEKIIFFSQDDKLITITFSCKMSDQSKWYPVNEFMANSLDILS